MSKMYVVHTKDGLSYAPFEPAGVGYLMSPIKSKQARDVFYAARKKDGLAIDADTAEVAYLMTGSQDIYGIEAHEPWGYGRTLWARNPGGPWICGCDIPSETLQALQDRRSLRLPIAGALGGWFDATEIVSVEEGIEFLKGIKKKAYFVLLKDGRELWISAEDYKNYREWFARTGGKLKIRKVEFP